MFITSDMWICSHYKCRLVQAVFSTRVFSDTFQLLLTL